MTSTIAPGSIVVGIDGSEHGDLAVERAAVQAACERRPLAVVAAARFASLQRTGGDAGTSRCTTTEALREVAALTDDAARRALAVAPGITVDARPQLGDPRQVLADLSARAHLLVVGSHGRSMFRGTPLGSVTAAVSRLATCPVLICRPSPGGAGDGVVAGADGTPGSLPVLELAFAQASLRGLPVTVVHTSRDVLAGVSRLPELCGTVVNESYLDELTTMLAATVTDLGEKYPDVTATLETRTGLLGAVLGPERRGWDLVVTGRPPSRRKDLLALPLPGTVAERSRCDVVVVPQGCTWS
ncbi:universal stress protein [Nocardioides sp. TF02-7]|uniref:universal stress protein n=1 Tax=Nocardioides sp. TF02-7 TaxID=2917724 RepID=UPI001F05296C|nr:universal stress protein [Nocardioides sp. TF02-7]UMG91894.1 universal stress protein [Nocardioides sp. TF02-7]